MKKYIFVTLALLTLVSCKSDEFAQDVVQKFTESAAFTIEANIATVFDDRTDNYRVLYNYQKGSNAAVKVLEPKEIAGVKAIIDAESALFKFQDTILETGMDLETVAPINVLHKLIQLWSFKQVSQVGREGDNILLIYDEGEYQFRTVFSEKNLPIYAEVMHGSELEMKIDFIKCEGIVNVD